MTENQRTVRADLHSHLRTRSDMTGYFNPAIDIARKRLGEGGIFGLINFADARYEQFAQERGYERQDLGNALYVPEQDILVVKGQEVPTKQGHVLVLGLEKGKHLAGDKELRDTIKEAKDNNGILIVDHPYSSHGGLGPFLMANPELIRQFDAWEVHNGEAALFKGANDKAQKIFDEDKILKSLVGQLSSSDGHSTYELGKNWTALRMPISYKLLKSSTDMQSTLRAAIRDTNYSPEGMKKHPAVFGALDHMIDLITVIGLSKLGIKI